jgi:hypothetical protein
VRDRRRRDAGSVMMLVPAGFLVLLMLAAITFDFAHAYLAQREVANVAESVANDAVTYAVDQGVLRNGGGVVLSQDRVDRIVEIARANPPSDVRITALDAQLDSAAGTVVVTIAGEVDPVFLRAIPGEAVPRTVHATASARIVP